MAKGVNVEYGSQDTEVASEMVLSQLDLNIQQIVAQDRLTKLKYWSYLVVMVDKEAINLGGLTKYLRLNNRNPDSEVYYYPGKKTTSSSHNVAKDHMYRHLNGHGSAIVSTCLTLNKVADQIKLTSHESQADMEAEESWYQLFGTWRNNIQKKAADQGKKSDRLKWTMINDRIETEQMKHLSPKEIHDARVLATKVDYPLMCYKICDHEHNLVSKRKFHLKLKLHCPESEIILLDFEVDSYKDVDLNIE